MGEMKVAWCQWGTLLFKCEIWTSRLMQPRPHLQFRTLFRQPKQVICWCWVRAYVSGIRLTVLRFYMSIEDETVDCVTWERHWSYWYFLHRNAFSPPYFCTVKRQHFIQSSLCLRDITISFILFTKNSSGEMYWSIVWDLNLKWSNPEA